MKRMHFSTDSLIILALVLAASLPTLMIWNRSLYLTADSFQYMRSGLNLISGHGFRDISGNFLSFFPPLYPIALGFASRFVPNVEMAARLTSLFGATLAVLAFYWLLSSSYPRHIAVIAALLFALLPLRVWSGQWILSEGLYLGLMLSAFAILFRKDRPTWLEHLLAGLLLGLAYLTRPEAALYAAVIVSMLVARLFYHRSKHLVTLAIFAASFAVIALPYHWWLHEESGSWLTTRLQCNFVHSETSYQGGGMQSQLSTHLSDDATRMELNPVDMSVPALLARYSFHMRIEITRLIYILGPHLLIPILLFFGGMIFLTQVLTRKSALQVQPGN